MAKREDLGEEHRVGCGIMNGRWGLLLVLVVLSLTMLSRCEAAPWEFAAELPGARFTYDLMTTERAVYAVLGDSTGHAMGLFKYDRFDPEAELEFVAKPGEPLYGVHVSGTEDQHIWLGTQGTGKVWYSSDSGETWMERSGVDERPMFALDGSTDGGRLYSAPRVGSCFQTSGDYGETWSTWGDCADGQVGTTCIETDFFDSDRAYSLSEDLLLFGCGIVVETVDAGESWEVVSGPCDLAVFAGVYPSPFQSGDVTIVVDGGIMWFRTDGDWDWDVGPSLTPVYGVVQPSWDDGSRWLAGGRWDGNLLVVRRSDSDWMEWTSGLPDFDRSWSEHEARMWACPLNGDVFLALPGMELWVYRAPTSSAPVPVLGAGPWGRVYPNPSRASVTLAFGNLERDSYELVLYDVLGRKVVSLHDGPLQGASTWKWDGRAADGQRVAPGLYLGRLTNRTGEPLLQKRILFLGH